MRTDHIVIALKGVRSRKLRSWLTMIGIFIGVAAVVALIGLGDGLRTAITSQFGISSTEVLSVQAGGLSSAGPPGAGVVNPLTQDDVDAISNLPSVRNSIGRILEQGKIEYAKKVAFSFVMSFPDGEDRKLAYEVLSIEPSQGRLLKDGDHDKVVLGYNFGTEDNEFQKKISVGDSVLINGKKFDVVGITKKKGSFIFDNIVHMNEDVMRDLFNVEKKVNVIAVRVRDKNNLEGAKEDIEKLLRKTRSVKKGEEDFLVQTPQATLSTLNDVLFGVQVFIVIVASISILVGALGIVNTMLTAVLERRSQIGIMKAIGARNYDIFILFFFESGFLGFIGGLVGVILGSSMSFIGTLAINSFVGSTTTPNINIMLILSALFASFLIGSIAGIIPAMRAARQHPVDALRD